MYPLPALTTGNPNEIYKIVGFNRWRKKAPRIISIDAEKAGDRFEHPFKTETLNMLRVVGHFPNMIKAINETPTVDTTLSDEDGEFFP